MKDNALIVLVLALVVLASCAVFAAVSSGAAERTAAHAINTAATIEANPASVVETIGQYRTTQAERESNSPLLYALACLPTLLVLLALAAPALRAGSDALKQARLLRGRRPSVRPTPAIDADYYPVPAVAEPAPRPALPDGGGVQWYQE